MFNKNEIKKELLKSKVMAVLSHYEKGNLYYNVQLADGLYQFPIATIEKNTKTYNVDVPDFGVFDLVVDNVMSLSSDLGETPFTNTERGSMLNRWIDKAIDKEEFIKVG